LLRNPGRLIPKDEIVGSVWSDSAVSDNSLTRGIAQLRRVLGDDSREPLYILTVPTVGYRFLSKVSVEDDGFGMRDGVPRAESDNTGVSGLHDSEAVQGVLPLGLENQLPVVLSSKTTASRRLLVAVLGAAALLVLLTGVLIRWGIGRRGVSDGHTAAYPLTERRVTSNPPEAPVIGASVSLDGKYVAYSDPTGLYLRQLSTGETRPLSLPKGFVAWAGSWFPDGTHLLALRVDGQPGADGVWRPSIYKLSLLGGEPQKIMDDAVRAPLSPDGSRIAYMPGPDFGRELWVMDADGANSRKVVSAGTRDQPGSLGSSIFNSAWSPNGNRLDYLEQHYIAGPDPVRPIFSLQTIDLNGGSPTVVLEDPRIGTALWWTPDGRILFAYREDPSGRQNNFGVYSIRVDEQTGKAVGPPQPITQAEGGIGGFSATADGKRLIISRTNAPIEVFIAKFDARSHQWKEPRRLTLDANENIADTWTLDGKAVLFVSNRNGTWKLFKQNIDETTPEVLVEGPGISLPRVSADGTQVLYLSAPGPADVSFPASLMSKPLAGGPPHLVLQEKGIINLECAQAPSKLCIFSNLAGRDLIFRAFDIEHGAGREVVRIANGYTNWSISPDGSKLAVFLDEHRIRFISVDTGASHDVTVKDWALNNGDWSADGQTVFMPSRTPSKAIPVFLEVDQAGKAKVVLEGGQYSQFYCLIQSPDGQNGLLLEAIPAENNAWMIDNF
jgi:Tol biopolymer transport system component/DNA-binding winged helix-turn-helix (wHTH) protein